MSTTIVTSIAQNSDSYMLGKHLAVEAWDQLGAATPDVIFVFASHQEDHRQLLQGVRSVTGSIPLVGCSTCGEFTGRNYHSHGGAACAMISSDTHHFSFSMQQGLRQDIEGTIRQAVHQLELRSLADHPHQTAIMLFDGLVPCGEQAVQAASRALGEGVALVGGGAGDNLTFRRTSVFFHDTVISNGVVFCGIQSKKPVGIAAMHGHYPFGEVCTVTRARNERVYEIDGLPAWQVWRGITRERRNELGLTDEALTRPDQLNRFFMSMQMGILTERGDYKLRAPQVTYPDGSLGFICAIPEGAQFRPMISDKQAQLSSVQRAARLAKVQTRSTPVGALIFDCVCRGVILDDEFDKSVRAFDETLQHLPFAGFETYGEICVREGQFKGFHNTTSVVLIIPD